MSHQFARHAASLGIARSVVRTGVCYDNTFVECFNASFKVERVNQPQYLTLEHAGRDIVQYIDFRYNRRRLHTSLDYRTPQEGYNEYLRKQHQQDVAQNYPLTAYSNSAEAAHERRSSPSNTPS